ncbi:hypothetical protein O6V14_04520 [Sphingomonas faeni]|uniref:hypothetical protein n=1 Tax=Sphingomonas faeni TaxID=185950 RepID=UPI0033541083
MTNQTVDDFANQLYALTTLTDAVALGIEGADLEAIGRAVWEKTTPALHEFFRARAIRMLQGDLSVMPAVHTIGMARA